MAAMGHGASWNAVSPKRWGPSTQNGSSVIEARKRGSLLPSSTTMSGRSAAIARRTARRPTSAKLFRRPFRWTSIPLIVAVGGAPIHPEQPHGLSYRIGPLGEITLKWKGSAKGGYFTVHRQVDDRVPFELIGATGKKHFVDETMPEGAWSACYLVYAHKGTRTSAPSQAVAAPAVPFRLAA